VVTFSEQNPKTYAQIPRELILNNSEFQIDQKLFGRLSKPTLTVFWSGPILPAQRMNNLVGKTLNGMDAAIVEHKPLVFFRRNDESTWWVD
jgi:hypothetical protein